MFSQPLLPLPTIFITPSSVSTSETPIEIRGAKILEQQQIKTGPAVRMDNASFTCTTLILLLFTHCISPGDQSTSTKTFLFYQIHSNPDVCLLFFSFSVGYMLVLIWAFNKVVLVPLFYSSFPIPSLEF